MQRKYDKTVEKSSENYMEYHEKYEQIEKLYLLIRNETDYLRRKESNTTRR